jgi:hypothetical protein
MIVLKSLYEIASPAIRRRGGKNMKKILILILVILGVAFYFMRSDAPSQPEPETKKTESFKPDPSSATFTLDDGSITLSNGAYEGDTERAELLPKQASGDINSDGKEDTAVLLASSGGASGVFIYVAAYVSGPVSYKGSNAIFIGDRISPESISISNGVVTFSYLDRKADEPFSAEPTVRSVKQFVYKNGTLEEK